MITDMNNTILVFPRDMYNHGKLLTELGHLALYMHDNEIPHLKIAESLNFNRDNFKVQLTECGFLYVKNLSIFVETSTRRRVYLMIGTTANRKGRFILECYYDYSQIPVWNASNNLNPEFLELIENLHMS